MIRLEEPKDYYEVENLTRESFWNVYRPGCFEHYLIHNLRKKDYFIKELDYVIELNGKIIANIVYALGNIKENNINKKVLIFGPVSVLPSYQHKGYGEKLINYTLDKAKELGYSCIFITGNQDYYKKYGFVSASKYNIYYEGLEPNEEYPFFMIKILNKDKFNIKEGIYTDPEVYTNIDNKDLEIFDKNFPHKEKLKLEGQLE